MSVTQPTAFVRPPLPGPDVCGVCRDWKALASTQCDNCINNANLLGAPSVHVHALTLYSRASPIRDLLTGYKNPQCSSQRLAHKAKIAQVLRTLLSQLHDQRLRWNAICIVPSTNTDRSHPLHVITNRSIDHRGLLIAPLQRGPIQLGHRRPHPDGYTTTARLDGRRVLILDDVYTTGARSQSAAHTLSHAGATITAIAVIGRRINPHATPELAEWSRRHGLTTQPPNTD